MAALTNVQTVTTVGIIPAAGATITAWSGTGDTISQDIVGTRGVWVEVANTSGGSIDFRVEDPGTTDVGNPAANGYTTHTVATATTRKVYISPYNVNTVNGTVKVGSGSAAVGTFTVAGPFRY